jgi:hypothetical protein
MPTTGPRQWTIKVLHARIIHLLSKHTNSRIQCSPAPAVASRPLESDLHDRADVWVNEDGAKETSPRCPN